MHIITQTRLRNFAKDHPASDKPLRAWETVVRAKKYQTPHEVKEDFPSVDFPGNGTAVFDIGGNKYRLVTKILYRAAKVLIRHVVTHKEYDRLNKLGLL
jgi:mRNA interferase HigB